MFLFCDRSPYGVVANVLHINIVKCEFEFQSRNFVRFMSNTLGRGMSILIPPSYVLNSNTTVLLQVRLWH